MQFRLHAVLSSPSLIAEDCSIIFTAVFGWDWSGIFCQWCYCVRFFYSTTTHWCESDHIRPFLHHHKQLKISHKLFLLQYSTVIAAVFAFDGIILFRSYFWTPMTHSLSNYDDGIWEMQCDGLLLLPCFLALIIQRSPNSCSHIVCFLPKYHILHTLSFSMGYPKNIPVLNSTYLYFSMESPNFAFF